MPKQMPYPHSVHPRAMNVVELPPPLRPFKIRINRDESKLEYTSSPAEFAYTVPIDTQGDQRIPTKVKVYFKTRGPNRTPIQYIISYAAPGGKSFLTKVWGKSSLEKHERFHPTQVIYTRSKLNREAPFLLESAHYIVSSRGEKMEINVSDPSLFNALPRAKDRRQFVYKISGDGEGTPVQEFEEQFGAKLFIPQPILSEPRLILDPEIHFEPHPGRGVGRRPSIVLGREPTPPKNNRGANLRKNRRGSLSNKGE